MVLLHCTTPSRIHGISCPPRAAITWQNSAATSLTLHSHSSVFAAPKLIQKSCSNRLISNAIATRAAEEERDAKPRQSWHALPSGLQLEIPQELINASRITLSPQVLSLESGGSGLKAPLVFVHGSYHAAWCWAVHWLPYFATLGYDCYAVSLLGQGDSDASSEPGTIQSHSRDIAHFVSQRCKRPPVLIGHSFGGLIVQYYLSQISTIVNGMSTDEWGEPYPHIAGAVLACSVPPTGNTAVVKRFLMSKPIASIKVTLSLAAKMFATSVPLCRETFFSPSMAEEDVARYQKLMKESSKVPLFDLRKLNSSLPVPSPVENAPPVLVVGAENDFILDKQGIEETASFLGTKEVIVPGIAHDVMLDVGWRDAADVVKSWMLTKF